MKRFLPLLILTGLLFGQDVLTLENGEQFKGKYLGNDAKQVAFKTRTKLMRFNMEEVKEIVSSDGEVVFSIEMLEQKKKSEMNPLLHLFYLKRIRTLWIYLKRPFAVVVIIVIIWRMI